MRLWTARAKKTEVGSRSCKEQILDPTTWSTSRSTVPSARNFAPTAIAGTETLTISHLLHMDKILARYPRPEARVSVLDRLRGFSTRLLTFAPVFGFIAGFLALSFLEEMFRSRTRSLVEIGRSSLLLGC